MSNNTPIYQPDELPDRHAIFAALRDALAHLYPEPENARVVVDDAGIAVIKITFSARAQTNWHNILVEALRQQRLEQLLAIACLDYPDNHPLRAACMAYDRLRIAGGTLVPAADFPGKHPDQSISTSGGAAIGRDVQLAQGDFVGRDQHLRSIRIDGDVSGSVLITGDNNQVIVGNAERRPSAAAEPLFMVAALPSDHVQRSAEFAQLVAYLLAGREKTVAITATIRGAGGFGKTTLAQALCHDSRIRAAFPDGILWATVGDDPANILPGLRKLYQALTRQEAQFVDQHDAVLQLREHLADRRCLLVIDDVWNAAHLQPFLEGGEQCARLVTTRIASVIPKGAEVVALDAMPVNEATALLGAGLTGVDPQALAPLARRLGEWPLLLKLVNRRLYDDITQYGLAPAAALAKITAELDEFGLTAFDAHDAAERNQAVAATIGLSLRRLQPAAPYGRTPVDEGARFRELAIFPEDTPIPLSTVALLWQQTENLSAGATERLCRRLADLALILRFDLQAATILLHDVTRHYLVDSAAPAELLAWHNALLAGYRVQCDSAWWRLPADGYLYQQLLWHFAQTQQQDALETLLFTYSWLDAKLQATDIVSLIADFDYRRDQQRQAPLSLLCHALQMAASVLIRDKDQLVSQLYGRLGGLDEPWQPFVAKVARQKRIAWLRPKAQKLTSPGGNLVYILSGHTDSVSNLLLTPNGRLISSCGNDLINIKDHTVKVWDLERGTLLHSLEGHTSGVAKLLLTPDGRLLSACSSYRRDHTVKIWDLEQGILLHSLEGHTDGIDNLLLTPDSRLLSSCNSDSGDHTVKVWDLERGILIHSLEGHTDGVANLLLTPDGRLISSCGNGLINIKDHTVKVWDLERGVLLHSLEGHTAGVAKLLLTPDGRLLSACSSNIYNSSIRNSSDHTVKVWDWERGVLLHSLEGHADGLAKLLLTPDGRRLSACCISGSSDHAVKVWDLERGVLLHSLEGHTYSIHNLLLTPDGRLLSSCGISGSRDHTVKVWDLEQSVLLHSLEGHTAGVSRLLLTPDGRLLSSCSSSGSRDHTVKVWDLEQGVLLHSLEGHTSGVSKLLLTPDGRLLSSCGSSGSRDHTVKVWDLERGVLLHSLEGHTAGIDNLLLTPDGRLLSSCSSSGSRDHTVKVWDLEQGVLFHSHKGHTDGVDNLLLTSDGRLLSSCSSGSRDHTVKVWDLEQGALLHSLEGHTAGVSKLLLTLDGRLLSSCGSSGSRDHTVKVWDLECGVLLHSLKGHTDGIDNLLLTSDGRLLSACGISRSRDHTVKVWDLEQGALLHSLKGHTYGISTLLLTLDGHLLSSCSSRDSRDHTVKVWNLEQGALLYTLEGHTDGVANLSLTPDGRLLSSCSNHTDHTVKVWDLKQGVLLHSLKGHTNGVSKLLLTPDGRLLSACEDSSYRWDHTVKVWDLERGVLLHSLEGHTYGIDNLLLTPDGRLLSSCGISSSRDYTVKVWDLAHGVLLYSLEGHTAGVSRLFLTPDGRLISSCGRYSSDHTVKVWDLERGVLMHSLESDVPFVQSKVLSRITGYLLTRSGSQLTVWNYDRGIRVAQFTADGSILSWQEAADGTIVVGDGLGRVHFLQLVEPA
jgi:WD40 repeat protein